MAENKNQTPETSESEVEKTSRIKDFTTKHPRAAKVVGVTAAALAVVGAVTVAKGLKKDGDSSPAEVVEGEFVPTTETA